MNAGRGWGGSVITNCTVLHAWWDPLRASVNDAVIGCCNRGPTRLSNIRVVNLLCEDTVLRILSINLQHIPGDPNQDAGVTEDSARVKRDIAALRGT